MHDWGYFVRKGTDRQKSTVLASLPEIALPQTPPGPTGRNPVGPLSLATFPAWWVWQCERVRACGERAGMACGGVRAAILS